MNCFPDHPDIDLIGPDTWVLNEDFAYYPSSPELEPVVAPKGMIFDFASIPWIFRPFLSPTGVLAKASVIHDYLYKYKSINGHPVSRSLADLYLLHAALDSGVGWFIRNAAHLAVRVGGWTRWN